MSSSCCLSFWRFHGVRLSYQPIIIVYLPANFLTHNHRTDPQRPTYSTFRHSSSFSPLFRDSTGYCQISRFHKLPCQKSHKNDLFWSFFLGLFWFFKVFFCDNCFGLFCSTFSIHHFSFTISFILACFSFSLRFRSFRPDFFFHFFFRFCKYDFVFLLYQITYIVSEYVYF